MPLRALMWTLVTVALALLAVGMWVRAVAPLMAGANAAAGGGAGAATQVGRIEPATRPGPEGTTTRAAHSAPAAGSEQSLRRLVHGTLLLAFVLICMLLVVGLAGAFREWVRYRTAGEGRIRRRPAKTQYVDAWKIAGERLKESGGRQEGDDERKGE